MSSTLDPETTLFVFLRSDREWKAVCCVPLSELRKLSKRPAKRFSYIAWCVHGAPGRLHLSKEPTSLEIPANSGAPFDIDPTAPVLPAECYFISNYAPCYIDLRMLADGTSTPRTDWQPRQWQNHFLKRLRQRDRQCVFSQASPFEAARRNRPYIQLTEARHQVPPHQQLHETDDPRNGLFLYCTLHKASSIGECTFLLVPNPYMDIEDVYTGAANTDYPHGNPDEDEDDYSVDEYGSDFVPPPPTPTTPLPARVTRQKEAEAAEEEEKADAEASAPDNKLQDHPGTLDPGMTDDSRLLLQWVGLYCSPIDVELFPNNSHAVLRLGTQLTTLGLHHAYACAIVNRWGRELSDGPDPQGTKSGSRKQKKKDKLAQKSPPFSSLYHSFLNPSI
ncbi:hypothetical protein C8R44DRAFT_977874 [Mycena epipterygia]|nr:hypothetical protein C8R44DRAFT_977874 [Mycena epipterygia]